jgi:transcriptional regulator with XRE-family HTH domain
LLALNVIFILQKRGEMMNERLKSLREHLNKSQDEFGKDLGLSRNYISLLENGQRNLSEQSIKVLCNEFSVNEEWLRTGTGEMFIEKSKDEEIAEMLADIQSAGEKSFKYRLIAALRKLNEKDWDSLEKLVDSMIENK